MLTKFLSHLRQQSLGALALFIVLGGSSYAVATGSINSREIKNNTIRSKDIRNNQVHSKDIRNHTIRSKDIRGSHITGAHVKDRSLTATDFRPGQLPAGPRGATGPAGATNVVVRTATGPGGAEVSCLAGERATGGGGSLEGGALGYSNPVPNTTGSTPTGWAALPAGPGLEEVTAYVICARP